MNHREHEVSISDWDGVVRALREIFHGMGIVREDEDGVAFESAAPGVLTGLSVRRDGLLAASMPLHGVEARVDRLLWDESRSWVRLVGEGLTYTYRIPPELLRHRSRP